MTDFQQALRQFIFQPDFVQAVFKGAQHGQTIPWRQVTIRPVLVRGHRLLQISWLDDKQDVTKNFADDEAKTAVDELLARPFRNWLVEGQNGRLHVQITKKGKAIIHREAAKHTPSSPLLAHNRQKTRWIPDDHPVPFLQAVGIQTQDGRIRASMQRKFKQINQFLKLIDEKMRFDELAKRPFHVIDFGCGNAYLTFALHYYLTELKGLTVTTDGVDLKETLMTRHNETAVSLGWPQVCFHPGTIAAFAPKHPPDMVVALHACDIATDEALAQAIRHDSRYIFSAPCCHAHLQQQLKQAQSPPPFPPLTRHGILKERLGDLLTDTFRVLILQIMGYQTDIVEFVSPEHTDKNLLIRAVKMYEPGYAPAAAEYKALRDFWRVRPYLETLLREKLMIED
ncbi:MAG: SAM-dependent methyltransferase [Candidatus Promineifilaceae bacterium]